MTSFLLEYFNGRRGTGDPAGSPELLLDLPHVRARPRAGALRLSAKVMRKGGIEARFAWNNASAAVPIRRRRGFRCAERHRVRRRGEFFREARCAGRDARASSCPAFRSVLRPVPKGLSGGGRKEW